MKYINTNSENTNACRNPINNSIVNTIKGAIKGTLAAYIVAVTTNHKSTAHANIFQNNLRVSESILVNSHTNSRKPMNNHNAISNIFTISHIINLKGFLILGIDGLIPTPCRGIYLSRKCNPLFLNQYTNDHKTPNTASIALKYTSVVTGLKLCSKNGFTDENISKNKPKRLFQSIYINKNSIYVFTEVGTLSDTVQKKSSIASTSISILATIKLLSFFDFKKLYHHTNIKNIKRDNKDVNNV